MRNKIPILPLIKEAGWVVIAQGVMLVGGIVLLSLITKNVSIQTFGLYSILLTFSSGIAQVLYGGINAATGRFYSVCVNDCRVQEYYKATKDIMIWLSGIVILGAVLIIFCAKYLGVIDQMEVYFLIVVFAIISAYKANLMRIQNAARLRSKVALFNLLEIILKLLLVVVMVRYFSDSLVALLGALICAIAVSCLYQHISVTNYIVDFFDEADDQGEGKYIFRKIVNFATPYVPWTLMVWVYQSSARWALDIYSGVDVVGGFMVLYQLCYSPMAIGFAALSSFLGPILYQRKPSDYYGNLWLKRPVTAYSVCAVLLLLIGAFLVIGSYYVNQQYFSLIVPKEYLAYSRYMGLVVVSGFFAGLGELFLLQFQKDMRVQAIRNIRLTCSFTGIVSIFVCAKLAGIEGVVYALLVTSVLNFLLFVLWRSKI